jgi:dipeptidyl aminopeptidase/acylaminoacyl peptidase
MRYAHRLMAALIGLLFGSLAVAIEVVPKRPLLPEDIAAIRWVAAPAVSPNGEHVAYVVIEWEQESQTERKSTLWLAATDGSQPPRAVAADHGRVGQPQWSPDGRSMAFLSSGTTNKGTKQVFLLAADESKATPLTDSAESVESFQWSPDGKAIAYLALAARTDGDSTAVKTDDEPIEVGKNRRNTLLWVIDIDSGKSRPVTDSNHHVLDFAWAPDKQQFAVTAAPSSDFDDIYQHTSLLVLDFGSGKTSRVLSQRVGGGFNVAWSADGTTIAFPERTPKRITSRLALVPAQGGESRDLLAGYQGSPFERIQWSTDSKQLWVQTFEGTQVRLLNVNPTDGSFERFANQIQNFWRYSVSKDGRTVVLNAETGQCPPNLFVFAEGKRPRQLTDMNPQLAQFALGNVREVTWKSKRDGRTIYGVVVTPHDYQPGQPRPTIVELHGGPSGWWWSGWLGTYVSRGQYFASHGFVTFLPNPRGSANLGVEFTESNIGDWGGGDYRDVMNGVDHLIEQKIADPGRLAIGGGSYGGYLTAWTTTQTNRFRAAVVDAGFVDLVTYNLTIDIARPMRDFLQGDEIHNRAFFHSRSPLTFIEQCKTPTLVLHGDKDERVPLSNGRSWHRGLQFLGIETEMVVFPGGGHLLTRRDHQLDTMRRVLAWYERHLRDDETEK